MDCTGRAEGREFWGGGLPCFRPSRAIPSSRRSWVTRSRRVFRDGGFMERGDAAVASSGAVKMEASESDDIIKEFLVESYENLDQLERDLVELESGDDS